MFKRVQRHFGNYQNILNHTVGIQNYIIFEIYDWQTLYQLNIVSKFPNKTKCYKWKIFGINNSCSGLRKERETSVCIKNLRGWFFHFPYSVKFCFGCVSLTQTCDFLSLTLINKKENKPPTQKLLPKIYLILSFFFHSMRRIHAISTKLAKKGILGNFYCTIKYFGRSLYVMCFKFADMAIAALQLVNKL